MTEDEKNYFNRQIQLWGESTQESLKTKKIAIIGCGGLGCSLAIALGSSGIGHIDLVDFDTVGVHNIHRQIGFKVGDEGKLKCEVLKELVESRNPFVEVTAFDTDFDTFSFTDDYYDLILDATDNLPVRAKINAFSKNKNIPWIYASVESFHGQVCFFENADFESVFNVTDHKPGGIAAPIVMYIASFQSNLALRHLADLKIKKDTLNYFFFNEDGDFNHQKFALPK
ncbi:MAG: HesA/MoeB/ThiF family protein [Arcobacteraceae bacterium]